MSHGLTAIRFVFMLALALALSCGAARADSVTVEIGDGGQAVTGGKQQGPPPHAPAHGYRNKMRLYHYYPASRVYFEPQRGVWFWSDGRNWRFGASLPLEIREGLSAYVNLELNSDQPYVYNARHMVEYPPGKYKNKDKVPPGQAKKKKK